MTSEVSNREEEPAGNHPEERFYDVSFGKIKVKYGKQRGPKLQHCFVGIFYTKMTNFMLFQTCVTFFLSAEPKEKMDKVFTLLFFIQWKWMGTGAVELYSGQTRSINLFFYELCAILHCFKSHTIDLCRDETEM